ncbi:hypothetical protein KGF56_000511 [Candida oxycetoniae]|uniref:SIS domain-containing protein n=1 Tax=Candida oxycetoniae TaxID=497107 RepID=A0AAI9T1E6_9ASCO|nr:uncharacterized protein KGF56_000511 [Candida oxycetoniae]KAI3406665.2 hypothetical protein KGF56_000511 [Candida oxycetoniae]
MMSQCQDQSLCPGSNNCNANLPDLLSSNPNAKANNTDTGTTTTSDTGAINDDSYSTKVSSPAKFFVQTALSSITNTLKLENEAVKHLYNQYQTDEFSINNLVESLSIMFKTFQKNGKIIISGIGKSYKLALKLVATLNSLSISSSNLHPSEALHGDLGLINDSVDCLIMLTSSGNTPELINLLPHLSQDLPIILLTCNKISKLSTSGRIKSLIFAELLPTHNEESIHGIPAPTVSTTLSLILADSVILALSELIENDLYKRRKLFGLKHPGGSIGVKLSSATSPTVSSLPSEVGSFSTTSLLSLKNFNSLSTANNTLNNTSAAIESDASGALEMFVPSRKPTSPSSSLSSSSSSSAAAAAAPSTSNNNCKTVTHEQILNLTELDILKWITLYDYLQVQDSNLKVKLTQVKQIYKDYYKNNHYTITGNSNDLTKEGDNNNNPDKDYHWNKFKWELLRSFK